MLQHLQEKLGSLGQVWEILAARYLFLLFLGRRKFVYVVLVLSLPLPSPSSDYTEQVEVNIHSILLKIRPPRILLNLVSFSLFKLTQYT